MTHQEIEAYPDKDIAAIAIPQSFPINWIHVASTYVNYLYLSNKIGSEGALIVASC